MTFEAPMYLTGDEPLAGYCGGCGEYVGPHHVCQPVERRCVVCGRPAQLFDVGAGPWCGVLCRVLGSCRWCQLPPSDAEGHWCISDAGTVWRRWES